MKFHGLILFSALKTTLVDLFVPRRPLKPARKERKKVKTQNITTSNANIVIRVVRAFNVPVREKVLANLRQSQVTPLHEERVENEQQVVDYISCIEALGTCFII